MAGLSRGDAPSNGRPERGGDVGPRIVLGAPSSRGLRGRSARHRAHQARRADLEEGGAAGRARRMGHGVMSRRDLAVDLGTANTLVYQQGKGIVYHEPTLVAVNTRNGAVLGVGRHVRELTANDPAHVAAARPLQRGAITDFDRTQQMMRIIVRRIRVGRVAVAWGSGCGLLLVTPCVPAA